MPTPKEKAREKEMTKHRKFRVNAVDGIARRFSMEIALQFERRMPVCFDVQIDPAIVKLYTHPLSARFAFMMYQN
mgnify:CR=1 FL=1